VLAIFGCLFHDGGPRTHAQYRTVKRFLGSAEWGVIRPPDCLRGQVETADVGVRSLTHEATRFGKEGAQILGSERHCAERSKARSASPRGISTRFRT
jgi:hypothetical protein